MLKEDFSFAELFAFKANAFYRGVVVNNNEKSSYKNNLNDTMIFEDYISKEALGAIPFKGPFSTKHSKAILSTFVLALLLSLATSTLSPNTDSEDANSNLIAANDSQLVDEQVPLAQAFGIQSSADSSNKDQLENYDDTLADVDLADADAQLDSEVSALAQKVDKDETVTSVGAKWITESVQSGDSISSLFSDLNIPASTLVSIIDSHSGSKALINKLNIGDKLSFLVGTKGELLVFIKPISKTEQLRFSQVNNKGQYEFVREKLNSFAMDDDAASLAFAKASTPVKAQDNTKATALAQTEAPKEVAASARGRLVLATIEKGQTFSQAANKAGITYTEINKILQMFKGKIQFSRNVRAGDTMRVLFSDSHGKGKILAVEFNLARSGKVASYLNPADGKYYDEHGMNATKASFVRFPFHARVRVTSQFNPSRRHPVTGRVRPHNGVDFGLPTGTIIQAPADGIVDKAAYSRSAGYYVVLRHSGGLSTVYMHLSKLSVKAGQRVRLGTAIARSGNTGISTGPHLHYEIRVNGRPVNPMRINLDNRKIQINQKARQAFAASVKRYKRELYQQNLIAKL